MGRGNGRGKGKKKRKKRKNLTFKEERLLLLSSWSIREKMTNSFLLSSRVIALLLLLTLKLGLSL